MILIIRYVAKRFDISKKLSISVGFWVQQLVLLLWYWSNTFRSFLVIHRQTTSNIYPKLGATVTAPSMKSLVRA